MCPPDDCFSSGCIGQRVTDKQPVACGVDTSSSSVAVGTTYTLKFVVYNTAGLKASVQRVVSVVSPCSASEFLCNGICSKVRRTVQQTMDFDCFGLGFLVVDPELITNVTLCHLRQDT